MKKGVEILDKFQAKYIQGVERQWGIQKTENENLYLNLRDRPRISAKIENVGEISKRTLRVSIC